MWKVKKIVDQQSVSLRLSGRLEGEQLGELQMAFAAEAPNEEVVLDLKEVKLVDQDAVTFLACCQASGIKLRNCPIYIREWIAREREARF
jgi:anti-anti-sigma regulatory factor